AARSRVTASGRNHYRLPRVTGSGHVEWPIRRRGRWGAPAPGMGFWERVTGVWAMSRRVTWVLLAVLVLAPLFGAVGPIRPAYADDPPEEFVIPDGQGSAATPEAEGSPISDDIPAADEDGEEGEEAEESPEPSPTSEPTEEASP